MQDGPPCHMSSQFDPLTERIIGCAIAVHRELGPGLLEATYEEALCIELELADLSFRRQMSVPVLYKGRSIGEYRLDLLIEDTVVVEIKSVERLQPLFDAQNPDVLVSHGQEGRTSHQLQLPLAQGWCQTTCSLSSVSP